MNKIAVVVVVVVISLNVFCKNCILISIKERKEILKSYTALDDMAGSISAALSGRSAKVLRRSGGARAPFPNGGW